MTFGIIINKTGQPILQEDCQFLLNQFQHVAFDETSVIQHKNVAMVQGKHYFFKNQKLSNPPQFFQQYGLMIADNAFISNRKELQERLKIHKPVSDTEIILHAYLKYGNSCIEILKGETPFAIWDSKKQKLLCSMNRTPEHSIYYYDTPNYLIISSLLPPLRDFVKSRLKKLELNNDYLLKNTFYLGADNHERMPFENFHKLFFGKFITLENYRLSLKTYWSLTGCNSDRKENFEQKHIEEFNNIIQNVTDNYLKESTTSTACQYSGGIDSTLILNTVLKSKYIDKKNMNIVGCDFEADIIQKILVSKTANQDSLKEAIRKNIAKDVLIKHVNDCKINYELLSGDKNLTAYHLSEFNHKYGAEITGQPSILMQEYLTRNHLQKNNGCIIFSGYYGNDIQSWDGETKHHWKYYIDRHLLRKRFKIDKHPAYTNAFVTKHHIIRKPRNHSEQIKEAFLNKYYNFSLNKAMDNLYKVRTINLLCQPEIIQLCLSLNNNAYKNNEGNRIFGIALAKQSPYYINKSALLRPLQASILIELDECDLWIDYVNKNKNCDFGIFDTKNIMKSLFYYRNLSETEKNDIKFRKNEKTYHYISLFSSLFNYKNLCQAIA